MAWTTGFENYTASSPADGIYNWIVYLKASIGWTEITSSDGSGNAVTSGASGTNGLDNQYAYIEIQDPGATYRMSWQRGTISSAYWRCAIYYGGSSGGTSTQVPAPSGSIAWVQIGGGTEASPTFEQFYSTTGSLVFHGVADTAQYGSTGVYRTWMMANVPSQSYSEGCFLLDAIEGHPSDTYSMVAFSKYSTAAGYRSFSPYQGYMSTSTALNITTGTTTSGKLQGPLGTSGTPTNFAYASVGATSNNFWANNYTIASQDCVWAWDNKHVRFPIYCGIFKTKPVALGTGLKGKLTSFYCAGNSLMVLGDTHNVSTSEAWVCVADVSVASSGAPTTMLPWVTNSIWSMT